MSYSKMMLILIFLFLVHCTIPPQTLTNSDNKSNKKEVIGFVQLKTNKPNLVSVFNMCTYNSFKIYRKDDSLSEYKEHGILKVDNPFIRGGQCQLPMFEDLANSKPTNRYRIRPIVNGIELDTIKVTHIIKD